MAKPISFALALMVITGFASANFMAFFNQTEASIPAGWTCLSCDSFPVEDQEYRNWFYERFPVCNLTAQQTGGAKTHTHTVGYLTGQVSVPSGTTTGLVGPDNGYNTAGPTHSHSSWTTSTFPANTTLPPYRNLLVIMSNIELPSVIPAGVIILFNSTTIPPGFTRFSEIDTLFPLGNVSVGTTGGMESHTHWNVTGILTGSTEAGVGDVPFKFSVARDSHTHPATYMNFSGVGNNTPPFYDMVFIQADSNQVIPNGTIGMFNQSISNSNWTQTTDCANDYIRANNSFNTTGGFANHTHANVTNNVSSGSSAGILLKIGTANYAQQSHTHVFNASASTVNNRPSYRTVLIYQYQANVSSLEDATKPILSIWEPTNKTYAISTIGLNHTETDNVALSVCWYNLNSGVNTTITCNVNTTFSSADGRYTLNLFANDTTNNVNTTNVNFTVDTVKPTPIIHRPANTTYSSTIIPLNHTETDAIQLAQCWYKLDSSANATVACNLNTTFIAAEGRHSLILFANDTANNLNSSNVSFSVDLTPPDLTLNRPINQSYNSTDQLLNFSVTDNLVLAQCWFRLDAGVNITLPNCKETSMAGLSEGAHSIRLWANDTANNVAQTALLYFTIDLTPPQICIWEPQNATYNLTYPELPLKVTANELISAWWYRVNQTGANSTFTPNATIIVGNNSNLIEVWANDTVGNLGYNYTYFTVNLTLAVTPTPGAATNHTKLIKRPWFEMDEEECYWLWPLSVWLCK